MNCLDRIAKRFYIETTTSLNKEHKELMRILINKQFSSKDALAVTIYDQNTVYGII